MRDDLLLAKIVQLAGKIEGRVKLQKMAFLVQQFGLGFRTIRFRLHTRGPFSADIAALTDSIVAQGLVVEHAVEFGPYDRYDYSVNPALKKSINEIPTDRRLSDAASKLVDLKVEVLEVASTWLFLEQSGSDPWQVEEQLRKVKGHLDAFFAEAESAIEEWRKSDLLPTATS